jgi:SAM-dependent methyltransferase
MFALGFEPGSFDVIWSEGAIYIIGFEKGLREWKPFLKNGGYLAVTELSWLKPDPPAEVKTFWQENYPHIQTREENLALLQKAGYRAVGHFTLPESAWWQDYYNPSEKRIAMLTEKYRDNDEALAFLDISQREIDLYRRYSEWYGYVFYVMQKVDDNSVEN